MAYKDQCPFDEGEIVVFKSVEELLSEFEATDYGSICTPFGFTNEMRQYCGTKHTVEAVQYSPIEKDWKIEFVNHGAEVGGYTIGAKMLKHATFNDDETEDLQTIDEADFMSIILGQ